MWRFSLFALVACSWLAVSTVEASPISYDFSGTFSAPVDGATQFSGTFTYDSNLPLNPNANQSSNIAYYTNPDSGSSITPISITFTTNGNVSSSSLGTITSAELSVWHDASYDSLNINVGYTDAAGKNLEMTIGMLNFNNQSPGTFTSLAPPANLSLSSFNGGTQFIFNSRPMGQAPPVVGTITSLHATGANVPEPTTLSVFLLAGGGIALRRFLKRRAGQADAV